MPKRNREQPVSFLETTLEEQLGKRRPLGSLASRQPSDAEIERGAAGDPDAPLLTEEQLRGGRSVVPSSEGKVLVSLRLDRDVVEAFRATGKGWQTRMNEVLRAADIPRSAPDGSDAAMLEEIDRSMQSAMQMMQLLRLRQRQLAKLQEGEEQKAAAHMRKRA